MKTIEMSQQEMRATNGGTKETAPWSPEWGTPTSAAYEADDYAGQSPIEGNGTTTDGYSMEAQAS